MAYKISNQTVIDDNRNVDGVKITASTNCTTNVGLTAQRTSTPTAGSIRYNSETQYVEYYDGTNWVELLAKSEPISPQGTRGLFGGGSPSNIIDYITMASTGNATSFGNLSVGRFVLGAISSSTRGIWGGGAAPAGSNVIDYVTIATTGNALDFGDLTLARWNLAGASNGTRGLFSGGQDSSSPAPGATRATVDTVVIATTGNATNFGNLSVARAQLAAVSSPTRATFAGGTPSTTGIANSDIIDSTIIASTGTVSDFGDLALARMGLAGCSSPTRGLFAGGFYYTPAGSFVYNIATIDYYTIESKAVSSNFGNLTLGRNNLAATSNSVRGIFAGGSFSPSPGNRNDIDYVTIESRGNATLFGTLTVARTGLAGCSDGHGGL